MRTCLSILFVLGWAVGVQAQEISASTGWVKIQPAKPQSITLTWRQPAAPETEQSQPKLTLSLCAQTSDTTTHYQIFHNKKPVGGVRRGFKRAVCDKEIREEITLIVGYNEISVTATNATSTTTETRSVTYLPPAPTPTAQKRIALVVANTNYSKYPLKNPINDGKAVKEQLEQLGFEVLFKENQPLKELKSSIDGFVAELEKGNVGLVFYAGHGLMVNGENYLQPIDADPTSEPDVEYECYSMRRLVARMETANPNGTNLVFWDACRNNPYRSWRRGAGDPTYALVQPPVGTMIVYATEPGKQALDSGDEKNGLFTSELIRHLSEPGVDISELVQRIDAGLVKRGFNQPPYIEGRLRGKFTFK